MPGRRRRRNRTAVLGVAILVVVGAATLLAPLLSPADPTKTDLRSALLHPSLGHPLGTDALGRDLLSRVLHGGRLSLGLTVFVVGAALLVAVPVGTAAAYYLGKVDMVVSRFIDVTLPFPPILVAIGFISVLGPGLGSAAVALTVSAIPPFVRIVRGAALAVRPEAYVEAAQAVGASDARILARYVVPNALPPILVAATYQLAVTILLLAGLGFIGLGVQPPTPEWGVLISDGRTYLRTAPHVALVPGLVLLVTVVGFNVTGDRLNDLLEPRRRL